MKRSTLFLFAFLLVTIAHAQINKGAILLGAELGVNTLNDKAQNISTTLTQKQSAFAILPSVGLAVRQNLMVGLQFGYGQATSRTESSQFSTATSTMKVYGAGLFIRKYIPLGKSFNAFLHQGVEYNSLRGEEKDNSTATQDTKGWAIGANFYPGVAYNLTRRFQLEMSLINLVSMNYQYERDSDPNWPQGRTVRRFSANSSLGGNVLPLSFGIRFLLNN